MFRVLRASLPAPALLRRSFSGLPSASPPGVSAAGAATAWTEGEELLRENVRSFAKSKIAPHVQSMDESAALHSSVLPDLFSQGLLGSCTPTSYGGAELSFTEACITIEELARVDPSVALVVDVHATLVSAAVTQWGSEAQKDKYLPRLAQDTLSSFCLSESASGSDAFAMEARARRDGDVWHLSGRKLWVTNAREAGLMLVFANAAPELKHRGITAFIVDAEQVEIGKSEKKLGMRATSCCEVDLTGVQVSDSNVLGGMGAGYRVAMESLNAGRIAIGAQMIGLARGVLDVTVPHLATRVQFGKPVLKHQGLAFQVAEEMARLEAANVLVYNAARKKDAGIEFMRDAIFAKMIAAKVASDIAARCVEWAGGVGFMKEFPAEKFYRDVVVGKIYEGSHNMHLKAVAKFVEQDYCE